MNSRWSKTARLPHAVSVSIKGDDFATLSEIAALYKAELSKIEGLKDIKDNLEDRKNEVQIYVKPEIAARTGITVYDVASTVRSCYDAP